MRAYTSPNKYADRINIIRRSPRSSPKRMQIPFQLQRKSLASLKRQTHATGKPAGRSTANRGGVHSMAICRVVVAGWVSKSSSTRVKFRFLFIFCPTRELIANALISASNRLLLAGWGGWIGHIATHIRMQTLASRAHAMHNANAYQPPSSHLPFAGVQQHNANWHVPLLH